MSIKQEPPPLPSKITVESAVGTEAPPTPPEEVDQFDVLFQFEDVEEIQYSFKEFLPFNFSP